MTKDKAGFDAETQRLKNEIKDLKQKLADQDSGEAKIYQRMQDATMRVAKLEKDLELQEEVLKKRHEEINSLNKENAKYKDQLD
jgi:peptidoglycan hydrolase CwlO-like protein